MAEAGVAVRTLKPDTEVEAEDEDADAAVSLVITHLSTRNIEAHPLLGARGTAYRKICPPSMAPNTGLIKLCLEVMCILCPISPYT